MFSSPRRLSVGLQHRWFLAVLLVPATVLSGCTSPRTADEIAADRARVLGTWEYHADGIRALQRGTLQIQVQDGKLVGRLQDSWRGPVETQVDLRGSYMELALSQLRITGQLEQGRFVGSVRESPWSVSSSETRTGSTGSFVARRVRRESSGDDRTDFGCTSLLRESSYACSLFRSH